MAANLQKELNKIKQSILSLGAMVEHRFRKAIDAVKQGDRAIAESIIDSDVEIDELEVDIEEECLKILALYQPVAVDLRFIIAVIKINNDLERVADEAVNIAQRVRTISGKNMGRYDFDYTRMAELAGLMLKKSLDALVQMDSDIAESVQITDKQVNAIRNDAYDAMKAAMITAPEYAGQIVNRYLISRHLERIGDHATNIAEEVRHLVDGRIVRHEI
ncbi:MAG: phosphate signaling complex protein PhoU [Desulfamplus sp.]|nr:phosphate signaling complex protein PhoU [Desulfamplus sp.]MBF0413008.1 phosphate signaling complex protein PhoU [Desulfamplus sp.]